MENKFFLASNGTSTAIVIDGVLFGAGIESAEIEIEGGKNIHIRLLDLDMEHIRLEKDTGKVREFVAAIMDGAWGGDLI